MRLRVKNDCFFTIIGGYKGISIISVCSHFCTFFQEIGVKVGKKTHKSPCCHMSLFAYCRQCADI